MRTILETSKELDRLQDGHAGVTLDESGVKEKRAAFEGTKVGGKIVMFEGGSHNPSLLINYRNHHISVPLSREEIIVLQQHFMDLLRVGKVA
ncbi:MAG: hypothetical protein QM488_12690 [Rhizobiaceae bacterium]